MSSTASDDLDEAFSNASGKERPKIYVSMAVDDLGLDPYEFRIYGHIARRGNCFASLKTIAETCRMSVRKAQYALNVLEGVGLIEKKKKKGRASNFTLAPPSRWLKSVRREEIEDMRKRVKCGEQIHSAPTSFPHPDEIF